MKTSSLDSPTAYRPSESEIREKAQELYIRSGWLPGRDLDNWLEAEAHLIAHPPVSASAAAAASTASAAIPRTSPTSRARVQRPRK